ncbi:MAG TPA: peptidoglycan DD-metalloendopeptidase family protein [Paenalcaligenes sp.]|nr:peptidoglycan DD-metalloendopeptidase family protein [Paenalcaligenes sp.]
MTLSGSRQWLLMTAVAVSAVLAGCSSTDKRAPITDLSVSPDETIAQVTESDSKEYTVQPGDTLYKIAREHNAKVHEIAQANQITDPSQLSVGQTLVVPGAGTAPSSPPDISSGSQVVAAPVDVAGSESQAQAKPVKTPEADQTKAESDKSEEGSSAPRASDADLIKWDWPNQGKVIKEFTPSSKGIDIAGQVGDPVLAAADGKVMYAGNGVRGLGNLILLGHSDGFITAYAHNDELLVKMGEQVTKGQKVATLGESEADSPRLHFEIRRRGTPVNPMSYLPKK